MNPQQRSTRITGLALVLSAAIASPVWAASHHGAHGAQGDQGKPAATAKEPAQATPGEMTDGEVRKVDKEAGRLTIRHATIKSLDMPPMTMVFVAKDKAMLDKLKAGDKIKFTAINDAGKYTVTEIQMAQ
jgi:Cu(I)/Ag(I) efflux system protein CusF